MVGSTSLGLVPCLDRLAYATKRIDPLGAWYPGWILVLFAALGLIAGALFCRKAALGGLASCVPGLSLLTAKGFIGGGGDGDLFFWFAGFGSSLFMLCAVAAGTRRTR